MKRWAARAEHIVALVPSGCLCPWGQVHMDMPWQKLSTTKGCPVHDLPPAAAPETGSMRGEAAQHAWVDEAAAAAVPSTHHVKAPPANPAVEVVEGPHDTVPREDLGGL